MKHRSGTRAKEITVSTGKHYFVEQTETGRYAVRAKGAERVSAIADTQKEAIGLVEQFNPDDRPDVERVRNTSQGGRDKWRPKNK
jgi:hypothetical protein